jgi:hypothetical protein
VNSESGTAVTNTKQIFTFSFTTRLGIDKSSYFRIKVPKSVFKITDSLFGVLYDDDRVIKKNIQFFIDEEYLWTSPTAVSMGTGTHVNLNVTLETLSTSSVG